jgi:hypothetical protein
VVKVKEAQESL